MKRANSPTSTQPAAKKGNWLTTIKPPAILVSSQPITDRGSTFVAFATPISTSSQAKGFQLFLKSYISPEHPSASDHEILAWRLLQLKLGKSGLGENGADDWVVSTGHAEDGEQNAGRKMVEVLTAEGAMDYCVVVSRWYGGIMLGAVRFEHIAKVTREAVQLLKEKLTLSSLIEKLLALDQRILRLQPSSSPQAGSVPKNYEEDETMTVIKAERLVMAREKRLEMLEKLKKKEEEKEKELITEVGAELIASGEASNEEEEFERTQGD